MRRRLVVVAVFAVSGLAVLLGLCDRGSGHETLVPPASAEIVAVTYGPVLAESGAGTGGLPAPACPASHDRVLDSLTAPSVARGAGSADRGHQPAVVASVALLGVGRHPHGGVAGGVAPRSGVAVDRLSLCVDRS